MATVGPFAENCFIFSVEGATQALVVDPGDEAERLIEAIDEAGVTPEAILLTHTHIDHVGAVAALNRRYGAPVYCPEIEREVLANINDFNPWRAQLGDYEPYEADQTVKGGEQLSLAGLTLDVYFVPGHSPGHVAYSIASDQALFSGDVLFESSIGRTDLPGGDYATLMQSIQMLLDKLPPETQVFPGHMSPTTLGRERETNPFLRELTHHNA
jgi:glyoxylase-like metal-dependent hydrolase (beta-lactamase superfamily II)